MKKLKILLRYWIALISLLGFLGGWITLAHAQKPIQPGVSNTSGAVTVPGLPTLQPLNMNGDASANNSNSADANNNGFNFQFSNSQPQYGFPVLRTRGS